MTVCEQKLGHGLSITFDPVSVHQLSQHSQLVVTDLKYLTAVNHAHMLERVAALPIVCLYVSLSTSFHAIFQKGLKLGSPNLVHAVPYRHSGAGMILVPIRQTEVGRTKARFNLVRQMAPVYTADTACAWMNV